MKRLTIKGLKSFTILEMVIVMALSSIVIVIALMAYSIINRQFINYQRQSIFMNHVSQFMNTFENDIYHAHKIEFVDNVITINKQIDECVYIVDEQQISRSVEGKIDTILNSIPVIEANYQVNVEGIGIITFNFILVQDTLVYLTPFLRSRELRN